MLKRLFAMLAIGITAVALVIAQNNNQQNTNTSTTRTRSVAPNPAQTPRPPAKPATTSTKTNTQKPRATEAAGQTAPAGSVLAAFNALLEGIRHANVKAVTNAYENSPRLMLFNNNGTVTRGWDQLKANRESSYPDLKEVKLDIRDLRVTMLGRDAALITCLWTQSQTFRGAPETASGRLTIVFRKIGTQWKAIHLHTSPDKPAPGSVMPSEQVPTPVPSPTP
jgi:ketosteroid isomerase-like protein